jgi:hypothetical protein
MDFQGLSFPQFGKIGKAGKSRDFFKQLPKAFCGGERGIRTLGAR